MVATYKIQSKITINKNYDCVYKSVDAILPKLINSLYAEDYDFEITAIDENKNTVIIQVYYEYDKRQELCQIFSVCANAWVKDYDIIVVQGVL